jgi:iron complex transport system substrate-binding protein
LDPVSLNDVLGDILRVGRATGVEDSAEHFVASLKRRVDSVKDKAALASSRPRVACLEWIEPVLVAGHWVPEIVDMAGGEDCLGDKDKPSFRIEWQQVLEQHPDVIVVTPCGFDVRRGLKEVDQLTSREGWGSLPAAQRGQVYVVDASAYFSRSGPRLVDGLEMMAEIIHPEIFSGMVPSGGASRIYGDAFAA